MFYSVICESNLLQYKHLGVYPINRIDRWGLSASDSVSYPVVGGEFTYPIRTEFDPNRAPMNANGYTTRNGHGGVDIPAPEGTDVLAAFGGKVKYVGKDSGDGKTTPYGNIIILDHENGIESRYAHLKNPPKIEVATPVDSGEKIGEVGNTGASTGSHLHFEVRKDNVPIDPRKGLNGSVDGKDQD